MSALHDRLFSRGKRFTIRYTFVLLKPIYLRKNLPELPSAAGETLAEIAKAKGGICKSGRPVVIGHQPESEALEELEQCAERVEAPVIKASEVPTAHFHPHCKYLGLYIGAQGLYSTSLVPPTRIEVLV